MADSTAYRKTLERGGFPAIGPKSGLIEIDGIDISAMASGDTVQLILSDDNLLVLAAGIEVETATTGATELDLGDGVTATLFGDGMLANAVGIVQDATYPGPQVLDAAATLTLTLTVANAGGTGIVRVWAYVVDINDVSGV